MLSNLIPGQQNPRRPKTHSNRALEKMRANHAEAQRAEQVKADAKAGKSPAPAPEQANNYFASIRNWFFSGHDAPMTTLGESSKSEASQAASEGSQKQAPARRKEPTQPGGRLEAKPEPESHGDGSSSIASFSSSSSFSSTSSSSSSSSYGDFSRSRSESFEELPSPTQETPTGSKRGNPTEKRPEKDSSRKFRGDDSVPVAKPNRRSKDFSKSLSAGSRSAEDSPVAQRSKERGPEGWSLSAEKPRSIKRNLSRTALEKVEEFQNLIREGYEPSVAASRLGPGTFFKHLKGSDRQFEIRLNQEHRISFQIDSEKKVVTILQIGGHT